MNESQQSSEFFSPQHSFQTAAYDYLISLSYTKCHEARYSLPKSGRIYKGASLHSQPQTLIVNKLSQVDLSQNYTQIVVNTRRLVVQRKEVTNSSWRHATTSSD